MAAPAVNSERCLWISSVYCRPASSNSRVPKIRPVTETVVQRVVHSQRGSDPHQGDLSVSSEINPRLRNALGAQRPQNLMLG